MPKSRAQTARKPEQPETEPSAPSPVEMLSAWNLEIGRFYLRRYQQYWKLPMRMQSLITQNDFKEVQSEFLADLAEDYRGEAARLSQIVDADNAAEPTVTTEVTAEATAEAKEREYAASLLKAQEDAAAIIDQAKAQAEKILASAHKRAQEVQPPKPATNAKEIRKTA